MAGVGDLFKELFERQSQAMTQYQETMTTSVKAWQDALAGMTPSASEEDSTNRLVPDAAKLAESYFGFAEKMLEQQHEFTMKLIEAMQPPKG